MPTIELQTGYKTPTNLKELFNTSGSFAGYHAVSSWLECPERSRLRSMGLTPIRYFKAELSDLDYGTLLHALHAERVLNGADAAVRLLYNLTAKGPDDEGLIPSDSDRALLMLQAYETTYPRATDPLQYLACEAEVITDIAPQGASPILRSVRYDTVVRSGDALFSLEVKSMARGGDSSVRPYFPQAYVQVAIWNANRALVEKYGEMRGVIFECLVKTQVPKVERRTPTYITKHQQQMALVYMRNSNVHFQVEPDGTYPKMLHSCWGRWKPCEYIPFCHEQSYGEFEARKETPE